MKAGRELDALVAEKVMGIVATTTASANHPWLVEGTPLKVPVPPFSTDIARAWQVVEKMHATGFEVSVNTMQDWIEKCECIVSKGVLLSVSANAPTAPLAICLAALKAKGVLS
jgi:hypothetical protein